MKIKLYLLNPQIPLSVVAELLLPLSSSLESEDSSLELSDLDNRLSCGVSSITGTLLWIVTHSSGLSTFATCTNSCCRSLSALVKLFPHVAHICSFVWSCTSRICLRSLQSSVNSLGQCYKQHNDMVLKSCSLYTSLTHQIRIQSYIFNSSKRMFLTSTCIYLLMNTRLTGQHAFLSV